MSETTEVEPDKLPAPFDKVTEADLGLPISSLALRILILLRLRCWSRDGLRGRELKLADLGKAVGGRGRVREGREAVSAALCELVQEGMVQATPRPGNLWRLVPTNTVAPVPDEALPPRFRRVTPEQKSAEPTSRNRLSRSQKSAQPTSRNRLSRSQKSAEPIAEIGSADRRNRLSRFLSDAPDLVRSVDPPDQPVDPPSLETPRSPFAALQELRRRHSEFVSSLPEDTRRLRVVWLVGTPNELAEGLRLETQCIAEAMFGGDLGRAEVVVWQVFEHAWRRAHAGQLPEKFLAKSLWGQGFRARLREWADAQLAARTDRREGEGSERPEQPEGPELSIEQLAELATEALAKLRTA